MHGKLVTYRRYNELTVEQAQYVNRAYPRGTDPWLYIYEIVAGSVADRFMMTERERVMA